MKIVNGEVVITTEELGGLIDNLTLLNQVDGGLQPIGNMDGAKFYHLMNKTYNDLFKKPSINHNAIAKALHDDALDMFHRNDQHLSEDRVSYNECYERAKDHLVWKIRDMKW